MIFIAFIADSFIVDGDVFSGGAEQHMYELIKQAQEEGAKVRVYQPAADNASYMVNGIEIQNIQCHRKAIWKKGSEQAKRDGCSHIHYNYLHFAIPSKTQVVTATDHGVWWDIPFIGKYSKWYPLNKLASIYLPIWRKKSKWQTMRRIKNCQAIIAGDSTLMRIVQSDLTEYRTRIHVSGNFCNLKQEVDSATMNVQNQQIEQAKRDNRLIILVPRNLSLVRGGAWLADLVRRVSSLTNGNCLFVVTGRFIFQTGREQVYQSAFQEQMKDIEDQLIVLGGTPHKKMQGLYQSSDIVLIPTYAAEGGSLSAIEGATYGKPVVATNVGGLNDVVVNGVTGLVTEASVDGMAEAIVRLYKDEREREEMGNNGKVYSKRYSLERWKKEIRPFTLKAGWIERHSTE
ncbi:glycosyltransferase family 4 protein [Paenibacillus aurantiacus]|uniref:Glycosyltransferase family 4 protein n=1 Tax=Paenibacillus aurantiacus TaxID=1936118 RepID=A0ABV5KP17_9BACL